MPRAISETELALYLSVLRLSQEQRNEAETRFETYLDDFEPLRAEMLEVALRFPTGGPMGAQKEFLKHVPRLISAVRGLDDAWFGRLEPVLSQTQRDLLPYVRLMRQRAVHSTIEVVAQFVGEDVPDVGALLHVLNPPMQAIEPLEPRLLEYQQRLAQGYAGVYEAAMRLCAADRPDAADALIERVRALRAMNRKFAEDIAALLPEDLAEKLRDLFFRRAYSTAVDVARLSILPQISTALSWRDLADDQREALVQQRRQAREFLRDLYKQLADVLDEQAIGLAPAQGAVGSPQLMEQLNVAHGRTVELHLRLRRSMAALLGPQRMDQLKHIQVEPIRAHSGWRAYCGVVAYVSRTPTGLPDTAPSWRIDPLTPVPITAADLTDYLGGLGADQQQRQSSLELFGEYTTRLESGLTPLRHEQARLLVVQPRGGTGDAGDPLERARAAETLRDRIGGMIEAADTALLQQIALVMGMTDDPRLARVTRLRERMRIAPGFLLRPEFDSNRSPDVDIVAVALRVGLAPGSWESIEPVASEYEAKRRKLVSTQAQMLARYQLEAQARLNGWLGDGGPEGQRRFMELAIQIQRHYEAMGETNTLMLSRFVENLPEQQGRMLTDEYNRLAFPDAYRDSDSADQALASAAELDDLSDQQQQRLAELRMEYANRCAEVRDRIIALCATLPPRVPTVSQTIGPEMLAARERAAQGWARAADQRGMINRRALRGLRMTLTAAQLDRVSLPLPVE